MEQIEKDRLKDLFAELPDEELPAGFQETVMERIRKDVVRAERRRERLTIFGLFVLIASLLALLFGLFSFLGVSLHWPQIRLSLSQYPSFFFYLYIGALVFCLWMADSFLRKTYRKRHIQ